MSPTYSPIVTDDPLTKLLIEHGMVRTYPKKAILITEGDEGNTIFVILSGRVKVYTSDQNGKEFVIATYYPGDILGEMALDGGPRSASVMATETTKCAVLTIHALREAITQDPDLAMGLIMRLIHRSRAATKAAKYLALQNVYARVARLLTELSVEQDGELVVSERLSQQDIAERVGSSRDMVNRIFKELERGGFIAVASKTIAIKKRLPAGW